MSVQAMLAHRYGAIPEAVGPYAAAKMLSEAARENELNASVPRRWTELDGSPVRDDRLVLIGGGVSRTTIVQWARAAAAKCQCRVRIAQGETDGTWAVSFSPAVR